MAACWVVRKADLMALCTAVPKAGMMVEELVVS